MTAMHLTITILQSSIQLWAAAAYGVAFARTGQGRYLGMAIGQVVILSTLLILLWGIALTAKGVVMVTAYGVFILAMSLWSLFMIMTNRSDPIHYPGYACARDLVTFRPPLPGWARRKR